MKSVFLAMLSPTLLYGTLLTDFSPGSPGWIAINDNVMGGVSTGTAVVTETQTLKFSGDISLENRGGFSSVRSTHETYALPGNGTMVLWLRGDSRGYFMDLRTGRRQGGFSYRAPFSPAGNGAWEEIRIPLRSFRPSAFGVDVPLVADLDPSAVVSIGFTLYDKKDGPFALEIDSIRFEAEGSAENNDSVTFENPVLGLIELAIQRGAPLFNRGQTAACAAIYEMAAHGLLQIPGDRLGEANQMLLTTALKEFARETDPASQAWILRRAFDRVAADPRHAAPPGP